MARHARLVTLTMPAALVITTAGINCDRELVEAFRLAGAHPERIHLNRLIAEPGLVDRFDLIGMPGGFGYGDAVAAGRIAAVLMRRHLYAALRRAIDRGVPIIAPCNGFQTAAQMGLLPGPAPDQVAPKDAPPATIALARNAGGRFVDRWVRTEIPADTRCIWTRGLRASGDAMMLPIAHGEGRFVTASADIMASLARSGQIAVRYAPDDNPNGSAAHVAGICDATGLVLGLMPHPERWTRWTHHPWWTRLGEDDRTGEPLGLMMFRQAVEAARSAAGGFDARPEVQVRRAADEAAPSSNR